MKDYLPWQGFGWMWSEPWFRWVRNEGWFGLWVRWFTFGLDGVSWWLGWIILPLGWDNHPWAEEIWPWVEKGCMWFESLVRGSRWHNHGSIMMGREVGRTAGEVGHGHGTCECDSCRRESSTASRKRLTAGRVHRSMNLFFISMK